MYEGHWVEVKVKVTGGKGRKSYSRNVILLSAVTLVL